jgi:uncharacterized protein (TIGR02996 family)
MRHFANENHMSAAREERAFLEAIIGAPDDDVPRLIFADWLDEQGETTRAEFIRQQVAEPGHSQTLLTGAWLRRRLAAHGVPDGEVELFDVPDWCRSMVVRRGFAEAVTLTGAAWVRHADALLTTHPIREVNIANVPNPYVVIQGAHRRPPTTEETLRNFEGKWPGLTFRLVGDEP